MLGMAGGLNLIITIVFIKQFSPKECLLEFTLFIPITLLLGQMIAYGVTICIDKYHNLAFINNNFSIATCWTFVVFLSILGCLSRIVSICKDSEEDPYFYYTVGDIVYTRAL